MLRAPEGARSTLHHNLPLMMPLMMHYLIFISPGGWIHVIH